MFPINYKLFTFIFLAAFVLTSCQSEQQQNTTETAITSVDVPELLDRNARIQNGKEWETIQNYYVDFKQNLAANPENVKDRLNLANLYIMEARVTGEHGHYYPAALQMLNEILEIQPEDDDIVFRTLTTKAGVQLSLHEFADALETAKKAVVFNSYNAQIYGVLVDCYVELGDYEKAVAMADKMVSIRPDLRSYSRVSYLREIHGQTEGAIEAMEMAVKAGYPSYEETAWARLTLGELHKNYGDKKAAKMHYTVALQEREDYPFAIAALADLEMEEGNYKKAEELLNDAAAIIPEVGFYEQMAHIYNETGRKAEKEQTVKEIYEMLADDVVHGHNMNMEYAAIYRDLENNYDKALEYALIEYEKRPENIDVNRLLATIYVKTGDRAKAEEHLTKASVTNSQHPELLELKADLLALK